MSSNTPFNFDNMSAIEDMDAYVDFSQTEFGQSPIQSRSPVGKLDQSAPSASVDPQQLVPLQRQQSQPRLYNAPSHEYGLWKQQTGFPAGSLANVEALNQMGASSKYGNQFNMNYNTGIDYSMDFGEGSSSSNSFLPDSFDEFVDPSAIDGQTTPVAPAQGPTRLFPGSHSQQAQQREAQLQQQRQMSAAKANAMAMRHASIDEKSSSPTPTANGDSNLSRLSREDAEMDEDERLLASEEGKKLSSKERRQLRNKVSARAFRSRRKEYISQLEGDLAAKAQEANDLKARVQQLETQNTQLTQLTRMLLNHPAFSQVMNDMSRDASILAPVKQEQQNRQAPSQNQNQNRQQSSQGGDNIIVGMTMLPESNLDFSTLNLGAMAGNQQQGSWAPQNFNFQQQQSVFAVRSLPEGPNPEELMAKRATAEKATMPIIPELPRLDGKQESTTLAPKNEATHPPMKSVDELDETDPELELYINKPAASASYTTSIAEAGRMLERSLNGKLSVHFELRVTKSTDEAALAAELDSMIAAAEVIYDRLEDAVRDLS